MTSSEFHLTPQDLQQRFHISVRTLERLRQDGSGPRFQKAGRKVLYRLTDVETWLQSRSFDTTAAARRAGIR